MLAAQVCGTRYIHGIRWSSCFKCILKYWKACVISATLIVIKITIFSNNYRYYPMKDEIDAKVSSIITSIEKDGTTSVKVDFINYNVQPCYRENFEECNQILLGHTQDKSKFTIKSFNWGNRLEEWDFVSVQPPSSLWIPRGRHQSADRRREDDPVIRYFDYITEVTDSCEKLARFGGVPQCDNEGDMNNLDGAKMICLDPEFQLPEKRKKNTCLAFSFGVFYDTSFDESMVVFNCKVHMYDVLDYSQPFFNKTDRMEFHQIGLANESYVVFSRGDNQTYQYNSLESIVIQSGLPLELLHVLKVDIEGNEWMVLKDMAEKQHMDVIGQIAVEIHALDMLNTSTKSIKDIERIASNNLETLQALEKRGFRKVFYAENNQPSRVLHYKGRKFETAGELLMINSNWRNNTFKQQLIDMGYQFKINQNHPSKM